MEKRTKIQRDMVFEISFFRFSEQIDTKVLTKTDTTSLYIVLRISKGLGGFKERDGIERESAGLEPH